MYSIGCKLRLDTLNVLWKDALLVKGGGKYFIPFYIWLKQRKSFPLLLSLIFRHYNHELYEDLEGRGQTTLLGNAAIWIIRQKESQF